MADREAVTRYKVEGAEEATRQISEVAAAHDRATAAAERQARTGPSSDINSMLGVRNDADRASFGLPALSEAADEQERLNAATEDYSQLLAQLNPELGGMAGAMRSAFRIAGDLGKRKLELGSIVKGVTGHVAANAASYTTLGAGGAAVGSLLILRKTWKELKEDIKQSREEAERFVEVQSKIAGQREEKRGTLADALIKNGKADQGTLDEAQKLEDRLRRSGFEDVSIETAAAYAGTGKDFSEVMAAAAAAEGGMLDLAAPERQRNRRLQRLLEDDKARKQIEDITRLRGQEIDRTTNRAKDQLDDYFVSEGWFSRDIVATGEDDAILAEIEKRTGKTGDDAKAELQRMRELREKARRKGVQVGELDPKARSIWTDSVDPAERDSIQLAQQLEHLDARQAANNMDALSGPQAAQGQPTVIHNHYNGRYYRSPDGPLGGNYPANWRERSGRG